MAEDRAHDRADDAPRRRIAVAVGSKNPVKMNAVSSTFLAYWPDAEIELSSHDVASGVRDQPWGDTETRQGALNRAEAAWSAHLIQSGAPPDFAVGLEGGVTEEDWASHTTPGLPGTSVSCFAYMAIMATSPSGGAPRWGVARTASFALPSRIVGLMRGNPPMELGDADDAVFSDTNSKQKGGTVAKLTNGLISRTAYYEHALHLALVPFAHEDSGLYDDAAADAPS
jgi:inosine/xanthosine triphosphatase